jgi:hypothetical protein
MGGGAAQGEAIREAIAARVPGAHDTPILDPTLVERTALMSTSLEEGDTMISSRTSTTRPQRLDQQRLQLLTVLSATAVQSSGASRKAVWSTPAPFGTTGDRRERRRR